MIDYVQYMMRTAGALDRSQTGHDRTPYVSAYWSVTCSHIALSVDPSIASWVPSHVRMHPHRYERLSLGGSSYHQGQMRPDPYHRLRAIGGIDCIASPFSFYRLLRFPQDRLCRRNLR